ncbi:MAG: replication initiator protein A [Planctomycetaceae bacterium]|nr:replication initiator protein A [Planctomycetaceae bacterium]
MKEQYSQQAVRDTVQFQRVLSDVSNGRDEMNLIDLPVFLLSTRSPNGAHVLEFEREEFDRNIKQPVRRKLTVTGDAKYGLPTAAAEEVYLGLLHHTKAWNEFADPLVHFSRGELLKTLGWGYRDSAYKRLTRSMDQIAGVRLKCENFWRDNRAKQYRTVENISIIDYYRFRDSRNRQTGRFEEYLSEFRWGGAMFESFDAGYLKRLDLSVALKLKPLARRLYRILDKHFHPPKRCRLTFDLRNFAQEWLGMSRSYDVAQIRRYLVPAIEELVQIGFLRPKSATERFAQKIGWRGHWDVIFELKGTSFVQTAARATSRSASLSARPNRPELRLFRAGRFVD